jgi:hypothetical protein
LFQCLSETVDQNEDSALVLVRTFLGRCTAHSNEEHSSATDYLATLTTAKKPNVIGFTQLNLLPLLKLSSALHPMAWYLNPYHKGTINLNFLNISFKYTKDCMLAGGDF